MARPAEPASPAKPAPGPADNVPDLEDFFVAVPPRAERPRGYGSYAAAPRILQDEPQRLFHPVEKTAPEQDPVQDIPASRPAASAADKPQAERYKLEPLDTGARVIGECFHTYLIAEDADGLILIDKHAAHERILFNKLRAETEILQQELLTPVIVELTGEEAAAIQSQLEDIRKAGFSIDPFGDNSFGGAQCAGLSGQRRCAERDRRAGGKSDGQPRDRTRPAG